MLGAAVLAPLVGQAARGALGRRRNVLVVMLALAPVLVAILLSAGGAVGTPATLAREVFTSLQLTIVIPIVALVLGTSALGTEIEDGTVIHLLARPIGRGWIIFAKVLVAAGGSAALAAASTLVTGLLLLGLDWPQLLLALVVASAVSGATYATLFVALSAYTNRALAAGLGYVLLWEGFIASFFAGTRLLSIRVYGELIAAGLAGRDAGDLGTDVQPIVATALATIVVVVAVRLGTVRLRRHEVSDGG